MYHTVTFCSYGSQVWPSYRVVSNLSLNQISSANSSIWLIPKSPNVGTANFIPKLLAIKPNCVSKSWPRFIREITHNELSTISIGCPSAEYGISSSGTTIETIPLFPCLHANLSQTSIFLVVAT